MLGLSTPPSAPGHDVGATPSQVVQLDNNCAPHAEASDTELRQFIAGQLSSHAAHVQSSLSEMEFRIIDSVRIAVAAVPNMSQAQGSVLRHSATSESIHEVTPYVILPKRECFNDLNESQGHEGERQTKNDYEREGKIKDELHIANDHRTGGESTVLTDLPQQLSEEGFPSFPGAIAHQSQSNSYMVGRDSNGTCKKRDSENDSVVAASVQTSRSKRSAKIFSVHDEMKQLSDTRRSQLASSWGEIKSGAGRSSWSSMNIMVAKTNHARLVSFVNSRTVELVISVLIVCNAIVIGAQVDDQMKSPRINGERSISFRVLDVLFTVIFAIELVLRLMVESIRGFFSRNNDKIYWNLFDFTLVVLSFFEEVLTVAFSSTPDVSMLRMFRILRLVRLFRIIRVMRFFRDLRVMVSGIAASMQSLAWALLLLFCVMYSAAVCVMQFAAEEGERRARDGGMLHEVEYEALEKYFGSLILSMYTMYTSITGGLDWKDASDPLFSLGWVLGTFYLAYIAFSVLCVLNIVTGVFVENCNKMTAKDEDLIYMEEIEQRKQWYGEVQELFESADTENSGFLNVKEFASKVQQDVRLQAWLRKIGVQIESYSRDGLFQLLDLDGDGQLDFDEFATALQQLNGHARSIDVAKIVRNTELLRKWMIAVLQKIAPEVVRRDRHVRQSLEHEMSDMS